MKQKLKAFNGFGIDMFSVNTIMVFKTFLETYECVCPHKAVEAWLCYSEAAEALEALIKKDLVIKGAPYRLSKKGIRYAKMAQDIIDVREKNKILLSDISDETVIKVDINNSEV